MTIDTLRADHLGCYGDASAATPALDALAQDAVVYDDVTAAAPITLPSHTTILTGLTPLSHGVRANGSFRLRSEVETLPERLRARGFATGAFVGAFVLHREFGLDQGFDVYDDQMPGGSSSRRFEFAERRAGEVLARAADWAMARKDVPFFLWTHLFDPHAPYDPPAPFASRFAANLYDGEIAYVDSELGRFLDRLRGAGILDRALLIVTSDHGEGLGEHGEKTHGLLLYQSTLRVPLLVRPPGGALHPWRVSRPVGLVDLTPSILAMLGVPDVASASPPIEGRPLPELSGAPGQASSGYYIENLMPFHYFGWSGLRGFREGARKLILSTGPELYDLAQDPAEGHDLATLDPGAVARLTARIEESSQAAGAGFGAGADRPDLSEDARQRLRSLGYAASTAPARRPEWGRGPDPRGMLAFFDDVDRAQHLLARGETREAAKILEALASSGPPSVAVLSCLGQARMEEGRIDEAIASFTRARELEPEDYEIHRRLAEGHYAKGEYPVALAAAREALRLNDRNPESLSVYGASLARLGRREEAIAEFRRAIALQPGEAGLFFNLGLVLEEASRPAEAKQAHAQALALDPRIAGARVSLGRILLSEGDLAGARAHLETAVRDDPADVGAREQLGITLARAGDPAGALAVFDRVVALAPGRAEGHFDRGLVLETLGRRTEAAAAFRAFLSRWRGDPARAAAARRHLERLGS